MPTIEVNPEQLKRKPIPEGVYPTRITKCEVQQQKGDPTKQKVYWELHIEGHDNPELNGKVLFAHTSIEPGQGDIYLRFVNGLGKNPAAFVTEEVQDTICLARITQSLGKDQVGDQEVQNNVAELMKA